MFLDYRIQRPTFGDTLGGPLLCHRSLFHESCQTDDDTPPRDLPARGRAGAGRVCGCPNLTHPARYSSSSWLLAEGRHGQRGRATLIRETFRTGTVGGLVMIPFALLFRSLGLRVNEYGRKTIEFVVGRSHRRSTPCSPWSSTSPSAGLSQCLCFSCSAAGSRGSVIGC